MKKSNLDTSSPPSKKRGPYKKRVHKKIDPIHEEVNEDLVDQEDLLDDDVVEKEIEEEEHIVEVHEEIEDEWDEEDSDITKPDKKPKLKEEKKKYYVDSNLLTTMIKQYYDDGIIIDELALALYNIANRISFMPNFINYTWKEEMVGDAIIKEFLALKNKKFDPLKGKAFSYFSMIAYNAFCNRIKKENKEKETIKNYQEEQYDEIFGKNDGGAGGSSDNEDF